MTRLSVNVNKLATLRNARGKNNPDLVQTTLDIIAWGAEGITVHPRPDERHIRQRDVLALAEAISVELNIEGYPDASFLSLVCAVKPAQCTLVPDAPHVLTSNAGWEIEKNRDQLKHAIDRLHTAGVRTSLFVDPLTLSAQELTCLQSLGTDRVELYTEAYAQAYGTPNQDNLLAVYQRVAREMHASGIALNAGHDLNLDNLAHFVHEVEHVAEVSIGHALICDALYLGLEETMARYLACLR